MFVLATCHMTLFGCWMGETKFGTSCLLPFKAVNFGLQNIQMKVLVLKSMKTAGHRTTCSALNTVPLQP